MFHIETGHLDASICKNGHLLRFAGVKIVNRTISGIFRLKMRFNAGRGFSRIDAALKCPIIDLWKIKN